MVGAAVTLGTTTVTSTQFGDYQITGVQTPTGSAPLITTVSARITLNGAIWSGQNTAVIPAGATVASNVHVVVSNQANQGAITGTVSDANGAPISGAQVVAAIPDTTDSTRFTNLASWVAFTNTSGVYTFPVLPGGFNYTLVASFPGDFNSTQHSQTFTGVTTTQSFTLAAGSSQPINPPTNLTSVAITTPTVDSRAVGGDIVSQTAINALRHWVLARRHLLGHRFASAGKTTIKNRGGRSTPAGSIIESDIFWDYDTATNLYGFEILRSVADATHYATLAILRDPLADRYSDVDPALTPDVFTYYDVAALDTVNFPAGNAAGESAPSQPQTVVQPLGPISLTSPAMGSNVSSSTPTLQWTAVNRATLYQVLVYDAFPSYQSDTDPNGILPIWPADPNNPGTSLVSAPATSVVYGGPALVSGHTYYWAVLSEDKVAADFSVSPVRSFVAP
ncbi:MAG: carboxypeptidase regulatory-like domain-containing protein [Armatimonadetes bacterium]|nr:carboxypeptidase regulatory-like domain-containing protein [Armatimonadota bacterium]MDE2206658.1 carboxypeptidase regulatory-like domain-containing protein [Armatimonadota bacterium]